MPFAKLPMLAHVEERQLVPVRKPTLQRRRIDANGHMRRQPPVRSHVSASLACKSAPLPAPAEPGDKAKAAGAPKPPSEPAWCCKSSTGNIRTTISHAQCICWIRIVGYL